MWNGPVLELETGEPRWYWAAALGLFATVVLALLVTPLRWPYSVGVVVAGLLSLWRSWLQLTGRAQFTRLLVYPGFSMALVDRAGRELAVEITGRCWVSSRLIVLPLEFPSGISKSIVIARERNPADAFRRFSVVCRFVFAVGQSERHNGFHPNAAQGASREIR